MNERQENRRSEENGNWYKMRRNVRRRKKSNNKLKIASNENEKFNRKNFQTPKREIFHFPILVDEVGKFSVHGKPHV